MEESKSTSCFLVPAVLLREENFFQIIENLFKLKDVNIKDGSTSRC